MSVNGTTDVSFVAFERMKGRCGGRMTLAGSRLEVGFIAEQVKQFGKDYVLENYNVSEAQIDGCLRMWRKP